ncbi:MAG TPA: hypothetical protein VGH28_10555 [Polyangiaceae bacterium]|jgi:hypothetical protein
MADKRATFNLDLKGNAAGVAKETSTAVDALADSIAKGEARAKEMSAELRKLRGSSAEVKAQKDKLKAAIGATNQAVTRDTLALHKLGTTTTEVARKQKQLADAQKQSAERMKKSTDEHRKQSDALKKAIGSIGGPANDVMGKLGGLSDVAEGLGTAGGAAAIGIAATAAAVVAVGGAALYGAASLTKFIVESQAAARQMNILRAAATGSEENAANLGSQVQALSKSVPIAKNELNALGIELSRTGMRGQTLVDTMNAVGQAQGVGDTALASQLEELTKRGQLTKRFQISPSELFGKNLRFDDIAGELAKSMNTGIDDARQALLAGTVPLEQGAAAMRKAVESKFGKANQALMLDPSKQVEKFEENLKTLTSGVNIEPLLHDMQDFFDLFDPEKTSSGAAIKQLVTSLGSDLVGSIHDSASAGNDFVRGLVLGALRVESSWLDTKVKLKKDIKEIRDEVKKLIDMIPTTNTAGMALKTALTGGGGKPKGGVGVAAATGESLTDLPFRLAGASLTGPKLFGKAIAYAIDSGFKDEAEIHSPSKKMQRNTDMMVKPVIDGLKGNAGAVYDAMNVMVAPALKPPSGGNVSTPSSGHAGGVRDVTLSVKIEVGSDRAARQLESPSFQTQLKKTLTDVLVQAGFGAPQ